VGQPIPGVEVTILDGEDRALPVGETGEIGVRGPNVMVGYYGLPEETARALRNGWLHTGDVGRLDADGFLYVVERKKDLIIRGGSTSIRGRWRRCSTPTPPSRRWPWWGCTIR